MRARRFTTMRRILLALLVLAAMAAVSALATDRLGLSIGHKKNATRLTKAPRYSFATGVLRQGHSGTWQLDDGTQLRVTDESRWREETTGVQGYPSAGRLVHLTGQKIGGEFLVRQATLMSRERQISLTRRIPVAEPDQPEPQEPH